MSKTEIAIMVMRWVFTAFLTYAVWKEQTGAATRAFVVLTVLNLESWALHIQVETARKRRSLERMKQDLEMLELFKKKRK